MKKVLVVFQNHEIPFTDAEWEVLEDGRLVVSGKDGKGSFRNWDFLTGSNEGGVDEKDQKSQIQ